MAIEYIEIIDNNPKPKKSISIRKTRKKRRKVPDYIELIERKPNASSRANPQAKDVRKKQVSLKNGKGRRQLDDDTLGAEPSSAIRRLPGISAAASGPDIGYGDPGATLVSCFTVDEVRAWLSSQQTSLDEKVERAFGWRKLPDACRGEANAILNEFGKVPAFIVSNDHLALEAFERLHRQLVSFVSTGPDNEVALITLISGDGGTSMDRPIIDVRTPRDRVNSIMRKMAPHWFGMTDLALFTTIQHPEGGLHLQRHEHVIAWGKDFIEKAIRMSDHHSAKFPPNITNLPVIKIVRAWDMSEVNLARLAAYLLKPPARAKNWFKNADGRDIMNHTEAKDRYIQFLRLQQIRSMLHFEDMIFGGNDGKKIKSSIIADMRGLAEAAARGRDTRHPDTLSTFWADFNKALRQDHWSVPAILRR